VFNVFQIPGRKGKFPTVVRGYVRVRPVIAGWTSKKVEFAPTRDSGRGIIIISRQQSLYMADVVDSGAG